MESGGRLIALGDVDKCESIRDGVDDTVCGTFVACSDGDGVGDGDKGCPRKR